jgi:hypothetical protein
MWLPIAGNLQARAAVAAPAHLLVALTAALMTAPAANHTTWYQDKALLLSERANSTVA